jgi:hypothetical protein
VDTYLACLRPRVKMPPPDAYIEQVGNTISLIGVPRSFLLPVYCLR